MNIYLLKSHIDSQEIAKKLNSYFQSYNTMCNLAVVAAESPAQAKAYLADKTDENVYLIEGVMEVTHIGQTIDPFNKHGVIEYACGTG